MASSPIILWQIDDETMERVIDFIFLGSKITTDGDCSHEIKRCLLLRRKAVTNLGSLILHSSCNSYILTLLCQQKSIWLKTCFSSSHVWMWESNHKEGWVPKNWCFQSVVLEKTLENPLNCKKMKPVNPKVNQTWGFIGRTDVEAEVPILWSPDAKSQLTGKDPVAGKVWRQEEKGTTEDEMVGWDHRLNGHEFEQALVMMKDREAWRAAV